MARKASLTRRTEETNISVSLDLDGRGVFEGTSGLGFLDHMLRLWAAHGLFDLALTVQGDLEVDAHHTVEDLGLCLGRAWKQALGEGRGIRRYGQALLPMDEALVLVAVDLSGRPFLAYDVPVGVPRLGALDAELVPEFLRAFVREAGLTLHLRKLAGENGHHLVEAVFKGLGQALRQAASLDPRLEGVPSTKGTLGW
ncbi:MAG: imidazoleglycerol-phosphate dehydratase HisB [Clostridia bacterium]|nr:imidazoleglycerol-phosphate dehydratase HisB [Clostridia bacterium]